MKPTAEQQYQLANNFFNQKHYPKAIGMLEELANSGVKPWSAQAQFDLGSYYHQGLGVVQDSNKAVAWYQKAANQGLAKAQYNLGYCYNQGEGIQQSREEALRLFGLAADQNDRRAQCSLGLAYYHGQGFVQNKDKALVLFKKSAAQGCVEAMLYVAVSEGKVDVEYDLGMRYLKGDVEVTQNEFAGLCFLRQAAEKGHQNARQMIKKLEADPKMGIPQDEKKAAENPGDKKDEKSSTKKLASE